MSDSIATLNRKISSAGDLRSVVRTMKSLAASSIGQYEKSVVALASYYQSVELGLGASFRQMLTSSMSEHIAPSGRDAVGAVVFGSDQGLVGQFNEAIATYAVGTLASLPGQHIVWAVGERVYEQLQEAGEEPIGLFAVPNSVQAITYLVGQIQVECEAKDEFLPLHVFYNSYQPGAAYEPKSQRLLPLDSRWQQDLTEAPWPTKCLPEVVGGAMTLRALIREYLFISLFRACSESLASENASRLSAMDRANKNIDDLLDSLETTFHRLRQNGIDEELFDVVSGFEALSGQERKPEKARRGA